MVPLRSGGPRRLALSVVILTALLLTGCDEDPTEPGVRNRLAGRVFRPDDRPAVGASVYLARNPEFPPALAPIVIDSTVTDAAGSYGFDGLTGAGWRVCAGVWDRGHVDLTQVSSYSPDCTYPDKTSPPLSVDLMLHDVLSDGVVSGKVTCFDGLAEGPADSAHVILYRYRGARLVFEAETWTSADGDYAMPAVRTGNYAAWASLAIGPITSEAPFPFFVAGETPAFFCDGRNLARAPHLLLSDTLVDKPAVYIYPTAAGTHQVRLEMARQVRLTRSIPEYGEGWNVFVECSGRIDGRWNYLFYEIAMTGSPLLRDGWCLGAGELRDGLDRIVRQLGLNDGETRDFLEYWMERLPPRPYWMVRPVIDGDLDSLVRLKVEPEPDSVRRFWLFFSGADEPLDLHPPRIPPFARDGGVLVEWGGAVVSEIRTLN